MLETIRGTLPGTPIVERMRIRSLLCLPVNLPPGLPGGFSFVRPKDLRIAALTIEFLTPVFGLRTLGVRQVDRLRLF